MFSTEAVIVLRNLNEYDAEVFYSVYEGEVTIEQVMLGSRCFMRFMTESELDKLQMAVEEEYESRFCSFWNEAVSK